MTQIEMLDSSVLSAGGPVQRPGRSKQDVSTPDDFIAAVERRFGKIACDLAASAGNKKGAGPYYSLEADSLEQPWAEDHPDGLLWLNPEFGDIQPWAEKCAFESRLRTGGIAMLVPASVGANWWIDHVHGRAMVHALRPRVKFVGHDAAFPKDLALCVYGMGSGFTIWDWGLQERFFASFVRDGDCWIWARGKFDSGYGAIGVRGKTRRAHRVAFELFKGPIPEDARVTHSCDRPACVNPRHLALGTPQSNMDDKVARNRQAHVTGNRKLEPEQVDDIRVRLARGELQAELAAAFDVSKSTISLIKSGVTWRNDA